MTNSNWWLCEMTDGGRFAVQSATCPDTTQDLRSTPEGIVGLTIAANSYKVISGTYTDEQIQFLLNPPRKNRVCDRRARSGDDRPHAERGRGD